MNITELRTAVRPYAPEAPVPIVDNMIREAGIRFAELKTFLRVIVETRVIGNPEILLIDPAGVEVYFDVESVNYVNGDNSMEVPFIDERLMSARLPTWRTEESEKPIGWFRSSEGTLTVVGTPELASEDNALEIKAWAKPSLTADVFPVLWAQENQQALIDGALWLLLDSRHPWANNVASEDFRNRFMAAAYQANKRAKQQTRVTREPAATRYGGL